MKQRKQRGVVQIIVLAVIVLVGLSILARCDIDNAQADEVTYYPEYTDAMDTNRCRCGNNLAGPAAVQSRL